MSITAKGKEYFQAVWDIKLYTCTVVNLPSSTKGKYFIFYCIFVSLPNGKLLLPCKPQ